jgi:hypothetical protein
MNKIICASQIQYILITDELSYSSSFFINSAFRLLEESPKDLLQLEDIIQLFEFSNRYLLKKGLELFLLPSFMFDGDKDKSVKQFHEYSDQFNNSVVKIFIVDDKIKNHEKVGEFIKSIAHSYFSIIGNSKDIILQYDIKYYFDSSIMLLDMFIRDRGILITTLNKIYPEMSFKPWDINKNNTFFKDNIFRFTKVLEGNFFILNQIIGNYWISEAKKFNDSYYRQNIIQPEDRIDNLLIQVNTIDNLSKIMLTENLTKVVNQFQPMLSPLILLAPYHFPNYKKFQKKQIISKKLKAVSKVLKLEQSKNYNFDVDKRITGLLSKKEIALILKTIQERISFLDSVGYFHAQLSYSPTIRLPLIGDSINSDLSYFNNYLPKESKFKTIEKFGKKLRDNILDEKLNNFISNRNGQIVAISDLPLEWMYLKEYPLCFTHDICRIPEFNQNSIVNNYLHNQRFNYTIPENLINKTLVVHCASESDDSMKKMFKLIDYYKSEFGFSSVHCSNIQDIKNAITKHEPDLLIFDCHGDFDKETFSSFLIIDEENNIRLTGDEIVANNISAPLVFLSACNTMPNYGFVRFLSDAFMQMGAFTVTTTYLPLSIDEAAKLIIRLLGKLFQLKQKVVHTNWLEFISHVLRTSLIHEIIKKEVLDKQKEVKIENSEIAEILTKSMQFEKRNESLEDLNKLIVKYGKNDNFNFNCIDNEWLSYSIIGRADLLYFDNWIIKYREVNGL